MRNGSTTDRSSHGVTGRSRARGAYTLVEMLIVLAILVMVASLSWPSLRRSMEKSRLESAAHELQQQLNKARTRAIKTGETLQVSWVSGQSSYQIGPVPQHWQSLTPTATGEQALTAQMADPAMVQGEAQPIVSSRKSFQLPPTVRFSVVDDATQLGTASSAPATIPVETAIPAIDPAFGAAGILENESSPSGTQTLKIYPDGRSHDATIHLTSDSGYSIEVHIRGVTGLAQASDIRLPASRSGQSETDASRIEEPSDSPQVNPPT